MKEYILLFLSVLFADNLLFEKMLGVDFALAIRKEKDITKLFFVATVASSCLSALLAHILGTKGISPLMCVALFPLMGVVYGFLFELITSKKETQKNHTFAVALAMNTALLGIAFACVTVTSLTSALVVGFSHGVGIILSAVIMMCLEEKIKYSNPPKFLGKTLLLLVSVAVVAMIFTAFDGFSLRYENIN